MTKVIKEWGTEYWLCNEAEYCCKRLVIAVGKQCSLHCHKVKKETFIVESGTVKMETMLPSNSHDPLLQHKANFFMEAGQSVTIQPYTYHRFASASDEVGAVILEVSTHHSDEDVVRLQPSGDKTEDWNVR